MRVLVACEYSGRVRDAFRDRGHYAMSCDLLPTERPGPHYLGDMFDVLCEPDDSMSILFEPWDLVIAHPPCTYLTNAAAWAYKEPDYVRYPGVGYHQKLKPGTLFGKARQQARKEAIEFVKRIWAMPVEKICIENPRGILGPILGRPTEVQPYEFGEDASKRTCLWLKNLEPLVPTKYFEPRMIDGKPRWGNQTDSGQNKLGASDDRWKDRSLTYQGIADAMALTWG